MPRFLRAGWLLRSRFNMRDLLVTLLVFGSIPLILRYPFFGIIVWTWLSLMNPHRLAWGFSTTMPFAFIVFITLMISYLPSKESKHIPVTREIVVLWLFVAWMLLTTINALYPAAAWEQWDKVWRIQVVILLTLMLTTSQQRLNWLVWTICVSIGFYGFKGGIWTLMTGGTHQVFGPPDTFIGGNNELGLAMIMIVPLLWYLIVITQRKWLKTGLFAAIAFTLISIVGTHSRGALLGLAAMGLMFFMKSRRKFLPLVLGLIFLVLLPTIMPEHWFDRMHTIETFEEDKSAMERIRAWNNAIRLADERFLGGGYDALIWYGGRDAHSIYFEVLGEHGFVGLSLFLLLGVLTWLSASKVRRLSKRCEQIRWAGELASMLQVTLAGYAVAGAFLGLAYFDLYYLIVICVIVVHRIVVAEIAADENAAQTNVSGSSANGSGYALNGPR